MRIQTFNILTLGRCVAKYPDEVCFAFNPNFVEIESECKTATLTVEVAEFRGNSSANDQSIKASMRDGKVRIYLSRLFELLFENPRLHRSLEVRVNIKVGSVALLSFETIVIWGSLAVGERFGAYGVYDHTSGKQYFERNLIWFRNFPFCVSLFQVDNNVTFFRRHDFGEYEQIMTPVVVEFDEIDDTTTELPLLNFVLVERPKIVYLKQLKRFVGLKNNIYYAVWSEDIEKNIGNSTLYCDVHKDSKPLNNIIYLLRDPEGLVQYRFVNNNLVCFGDYHSRGFVDCPALDLFPSIEKSATIRYNIGFTSTFDLTFDNTFIQNPNNVAIVNLRVSNETAGHYLRWIDRQGNLQYFLFTKGQITHKNKLGTDLVADDFDVNGTYFANHSRTRSLDCSVTMKCCAVNLEKDIFDYVVSILSAPLVDLYRGKDAYGEEIWLPVNIQASSVDYSPTRILNDLEFSFNIPDVNSQSL